MRKCHGEKGKHKGNERIDGGEKKTDPRIQTIAPTTDKIRARKANGSPIKNPNGLQSPIFSPLLLSFQAFFDPKSLSLSLSFLICLGRQEDRKKDKRGCKL